METGRASLPPGTFGQGGPRGDRWGRGGDRWGLGAPSEGGSELAGEA